MRVTVENQQVTETKDYKGINPADRTCARNLCVCIAKRQAPYSEIELTVIEVFDDVFVVGAADPAPQFWIAEKIEDGLWCFSSGKLMKESLEALVPAFLADSHNN